MLQLHAVLDKALADVVPGHEALRTGAEEAARERAERLQHEERATHAGAERAQAALEALRQELTQSGAAKEALELKLAAQVAELAAMRLRQEALPEATSESIGGDLGRRAAAKPSTALAEELRVWRYENVPGIPKDEYANL